MHITLKHSEKAAEVNVEALEAGSNLDVFLHKYYPEIPGLFSYIVIVLSLASQFAFYVTNKNNAEKHF